MHSLTTCFARVFYPHVLKTSPHVLLCRVSPHHVFYSDVCLLITCFTLMCVSSSRVLPSRVSPQHLFCPPVCLLTTCFTLTYISSPHELPSRMSLCRILPSDLLITCFALTCSLSPCVPTSVISQPAHQDEFAYLNAGESSIITGVDDAADFQETCRALALLGISDSSLRSFFTVLAALLHLGNVELAETSPDSCAIPVSSCPVTKPTQLYFRFLWQARSSDVY